MSQPTPNQPSQASVAEQVEKNKRDALRLADEIFRVVKDNEFLRLKPEVRMNVVKEKCPEFCKHYPMVASWMTYHLKYSRKAFAKYLDKLANEHGKREVKQGEGYKEWARKQADYAKILYMETTDHWNSKTAGKIWNTEYSRIIKAYDEMKEEESKYKSEFDEEKKQHHEELIDEILDLVGTAKKQQRQTNAELNKADDIVDEDLERRAVEIQDLIEHKVRVAEGDEIESEEEEDLTPEQLEKRRIRREKEQIRRTAELELLKQRQKEAAEAAIIRDKVVKESFLPANLTTQPIKNHKRKKTRRNKKRR